MNNNKKPYYERYWWIPFVISGIALGMSIVRIILI